MSGGSPGAGVLAGIRVIDLASFIAAPAAATIMADLGADVIKIEPPGTGDPYRNIRHSPGAPPTDIDYAWLLDNRSKRGLALDLKRPAGRAVLDRLLERADVLVTNLPLPARERLRVRWEDVREVNPRLVYASLTAYGETGPEAASTGFDSTAWWARTGLMDMVRPAPDSPPARSLPGMGDHPSAATLFGAIMAGLYHRERTGEGIEVATSLFANGLWSNGIYVQAMLCGARYERRPPREAAASALHNLYRTADDRWLHLVVIPEEKRWPVLTRALGHPELAGDPRFATRAARHAHPGALVRELDRIFATRTLEQWRAILDRHGITYGVVATLEEVPRDRQAIESDALTPYDDPDARVERVVASPVWLRGQPKRPPGPPPRLGEHSRDILAEHGYSDEEIERLREEGIVGVAGAGQATSDAPPAGGGEQGAPGGGDA